MSMNDEIDDLEFEGKEMEEVSFALARFTRRAVIPLSLMELQNFDFLPRDWDVLEHVLEKAEKAKAHFGNEVLDAPGLIKVGNLAYCKTDFVMAADLYQRSLELRVSVTAMMNLGITLLASGRSDDAREVLEKASDLSKDDHAIWFYIGLTWEQDAASAAGLIRDGKGKDFKGLKEVYLNNALEHYEKALELEPSFGPARYNKGVVLTLLGRKEEAKEVMTDILKQNPASEASWIAQGLVLRSQDDLEGALKCYENAITINQDSHFAWLNKSVALFALKRFKECLEAAENSITLDPASDIAWSNKGAILSELHRYKEAVECFDKALEINPAFEGAKRNRKKALGSLEGDEAKDEG